MTWTGRLKGIPYPPGMEGQRPTGRNLSAGRTGTSLAKTVRNPGRIGAFPTDDPLRLNNERLLWMGHL